MKVDDDSLEPLGGVDCKIRIPWYFLLLVLLVILGGLTDA